MVQKVWYSYDDIHRVVPEIAEKIKQSGIQYEAIIAIGGGGFIPARMLRTFLGEFLLSRKLKIRFVLDGLLECFLVSAFVATSWFLNGVVGMISL